MSDSIDIDYTAKLARIALTEDERERFSNQLKDILHYFDRLNEVDVEGVEPMAHAFQLENVLREDVADAGLTPEEAMKHAPKQRDNMVVVPKVVDG